jgi:uncharacterized membrane protein YdbT with pleckstrin-like domain
VLEQIREGGEGEAPVTETRQVKVLYTASLAGVFVTGLLTQDVMTMVRATVFSAPPPVERKFWWQLVLRFLLPGAAAYSLKSWGW